MPEVSFSGLLIVAIVAFLTLPHVNWPWRRGRGVTYYRTFYPTVKNIRKGIERFFQKNK